ncbi:MAG: oxygen-independent coproporphyrinogen III oxidase [Pseudomonadota bacterium]
MKNLVPEEILAKYGSAVPRYTSYPTAPHFSEEAGRPILETALAGLTATDRISVYIHIPFCDRLCWFCGCHTRHTLKYHPVEAYISSLLDEIRLVGQRLQARPVIGHLHLGGGSPSMVRSVDFERISQALHQNFSFLPDTETSVEIDPSDVNDDTLEGLRKLGMTRASIGVQDFDPQVQAAINRPQTFEQTRDVINALRSLGVQSLNIDALYGLPLQTADRLSRTIEKVVSLTPDRIALFGYAHIPWLKKHQRLIKDSDLPGTSERFHQERQASIQLADAGYQEIGIDHFALPGDLLAGAARSGKLRRNFQGYTTDNCKILLGLGASSIGKTEAGYLQNIVPTGQYSACVKSGALPANRGLILTEDDKIRAHIIEQIMCDFRFGFEDLLSRFGAKAIPYLAEAKNLAAADVDDLCSADQDCFYVNAAARPFTRIVASRFDAYLAQSQFRYSKAV